MEETLPDYSPSAINISKDLVCDILHNANRLQTSIDISCQTYREASDETQASFHQEDEPQRFATDIESLKSTIIKLEPTVLSSETIIKEGTNFV